MIRFARLGCLVILLGGAAAADDRKDVPKELTRFQGTWRVTEASLGGVPAPKETLESLAFTFDGTKLTVAEKGEAEDGTFAVDSKKDPATIDLINKKGDKVLGIYKFDKDDKLTLSFVKERDAARPKGFDDKGAAIMVLEKMK